MLTDEVVKATIDKIIENRHRPIPARNLFPDTEILYDYECQYCGALCTLEPEPRGALLTEPCWKNMKST